MDLIDDRGRLLGVVNVIDAFVVLMVAAVLVAGVSVVASSGGRDAPPPGEDNETGTPASANVTEDRTVFATRYATIDLGTQPLYLASLLSRGDTRAMEDGGSLSVTDVYVGPADGRTAAVVVRARIRGRVANATSGDGHVVFGNSRLRPGTEFTLSTDEYSLAGRITVVDRNDGSLATERVPLLLEATLPPSIAERVAADDAYRVGGRTVARIDAVRTVPAGNTTKRRVFLGVTVETIDRSGDRFFGTHPVALERSLPFRTGNYSVSGRVVSVGSRSLPGTPTETTARIELAGLSPERAENLRVGMTETSGGTTVARVTEKRVAPATVVLTSRNGDIHEREHPTKKDVVLTVSLRTRRTDTGLLFHGRSIREGTRLVLDFRTIRVRGTVIDIE